MPRKRVLFFHVLCVCLGMSALAAGAAHCGSARAEDDGETAEDGASTESAAFDASGPDDAISGFDVPWPVYDVTFVDQGTTCLDGALQPGAPWQHESCCEGVVCEGYCIRADDGGAACDCYGVSGGCWDGSVCCTRRNGCASPDMCSFSK